MRKIILLATLVLAGCTTADGHTRCFVCYEDEWSREPFPGQEKQHIPTVDTRTEELKKGTPE